MRKNVSFNELQNTFTLLMVWSTHLKVILSIDVRLGQFILYLQSGISNLHHTELISFSIFAVLLIWILIFLLSPEWAGHTPGPTCTSGKRFSTLHRSGTPWEQGSEKTRKIKPQKKSCFGVDLSDRQVKRSRKEIMFVGEPQSSWTSSSPPDTTWRWWRASCRSCILSLETFGL